MRRTLLLMRHGKSDWGTSAQPDFERPLKPRGLEAAQRIAAWIAAEQVVPDMIISSDAVRARDTARALADALGVDQARLHFDRRVYEADQDTLLNVIAECPDDVGRLMLVGHNPGLELLTAFLSREPLTPASNGKIMPTATLAVLHHGSPWHALHVAACPEARFVRPRELAAD